MIEIGTELVFDLRYPEFLSPAMIQWNMLPIRPKTQLQWKNGVRVSIEERGVKQDNRTNFK